jgi:hypothetical protein
MKTIKFDLKLKNGEITLRTLDDLEENLSPELLTHFHSGKLAKWLRVRKLEELAEKMEALRAQHLDDKNELDVKLFKNLCEIFVSEVDENDAREAVADFKAVEPSDENSNDEEVEQLKAENEEIKTQNEKLNQDIEALKEENLKFKPIFCNTCNGTGKETNKGGNGGGFFRELNRFQELHEKLPLSPCLVCGGLGRLFKKL